MTVEIQGAEYIANFIQKQNIEVVFGLTGGYIHHTIDAICEKTKVKFITVHHEQSPSFAADGYSRISNKHGVCMGISGPGGINMLAGIAHAFYDSYPIICITGQVNLNEMVGERKIRQHGFQECDIVSIMSPVTKKSVLVKSSADLDCILHSLFEIALTGRKGPCLIDIPLNIQSSVKPYANPRHVTRPCANVTEKIKLQIEEILIALSNSKKPLFLLGGGICSSGTRKIAKELIDRLDVPCVHSLLACDVIPFSHPSYIGMIGTYGVRIANTVVMESDLLVVLGSRLDIRQTGTDTKSFENRKIYHVDIDKEEVNFRIKGVTHVHVDLLTFFEEMLRQTKLRHCILDCSKWRIEIAKQKIIWDRNNELIDFGTDKIDPNKFVNVLSKHSMKYNTNYTVGIGNVQMWAAQSIELIWDQRLLIPGGLSSMGSALPMAIGACFAHEVPVPYVVLEGDGGIPLNIQELQTVVRNKLPIKIVIMNNSSLGMIRQFCIQNFDNRFNQIQDGLGYDAPNFCKIGKAYNIDSYTLEHPKDIKHALIRMWKYPLRPYILDVKIPIESYVAPKVLFGSSLKQMIPTTPKNYPHTKTKFITSD